MKWYKYKKRIRRWNTNKIYFLFSQFSSKSSHTHKYKNNSICYCVHNHTHFPPNFHFLTSDTSLQLVARLWPTTRWCLSTQQTHRHRVLLYWAGARIRITNTICRNQIAKRLALAFLSLCVKENYKFVEKLKKKK